MASHFHVDLELDTSTNENGYQQVRMVSNAQGQKLNQYHLGGHPLEMPAKIPCICRLNSVGLGYHQSLPI
jgi:hypothetical protein